MNKDDNKITEQGLNSSKDKKVEWKKNLKIVIAMLLVAALSVGGTLAYLSRETSELENVFTGSKGISLTLTEPEFDDEEKGKANSYTPDMTILKDPTVTNTSTETGYKEWVAMRVDYTFAGSACNKEQIDDIVTFQYKDENGDFQDGLNPNWIKVTTTTDGLAATNYDIYVYNAMLDDNGGKATLFDRVITHDQTTLETNQIFDSAVDVNKYKDFKITVCAAAIKNDTTLGGISSIENTQLKELNIGSISTESSLAITDSSSENDKLKHYAQEIEIALVKLLVTP